MTTNQPLTMAPQHLAAAVNNADDALGELRQLGRAHLHAAYLKYFVERLKVAADEIHLLVFGARSTDGGGPATPTTRRRD